MEQNITVIEITKILSSGHKIIKHILVQEKPTVCSLYNLAENWCMSELSGTNGYTWSYRIVEDNKERTKILTKEADKLNKEIDDNYKLLTKIQEDIKNN
ncbi:MAG: hypothetical protein ACOCVF_00890 [bacterium]